MSNTRHVDLAKLAAVMRGQLPATPQPTPPRSSRRREDPFPRVPAERFEELLADAEFAGPARQDVDVSSTRADMPTHERYLAMLGVPGMGTIHYQGRPR